MACSSWATIVIIGKRRLQSPFVQMMPWGVTLAIEAARPSKGKACLQ